MLLISCDSSPNEPVKTNDLPVSLNLTPAFIDGYDIDRVNVKIIKSVFSDEMDLEIDGMNANGTFHNLEIGTYSVFIKAFVGDVLTAVGEGLAEVKSGQTTTINITLEFVDGSLEIVIDWDNPPSVPQNILFVGNSHTYTNGGLENHFRALMEENFPETVFNIQSVTFGGYTLEQHFHNSTTIETIQNGEWDFVVLQEQSTRPVEQTELFYTYADSLNQIIRASDSQTAFFMTWEHEFNEGWIVPISEAYHTISDSLDALLCPIGEAWELAEDRNPEINFYSPDGNHCNILGVYLNACTFFSLFAGESAEGLLYNIEDQISTRDRLLLQEVGWDIYNQ